MPTLVSTVLCGSLSLHPVRLGAAMHTAGYRALSLPYAYIPFKISSASLPGALAGMRALGIRGFGISMPFKQEIIPLLDTLEPTAARIGAVNTVVNENGVLSGHNTDWIGAIQALKEVRPQLRGARVLLLGAGGAARALAFGLAKEGAELCIANRNAEKANSLAAELGVRSASSAEFQRASGYEIVINATSAGMLEVDPHSPIPKSALRPGLIVMDIVYKPIETELIRWAAEAGATAIHGGRMLLHQAAHQFELYTGHQAPLQAMDEALAEQLRA